MQRNDTKTYPIEFFVHHKLNNFRDIRLFAKSGEITDSLLVKKYSTEYFLHFFDSSHSYLPRGYESFSFTNDDSIINIMDTGAVFAKRTSIHKYDNHQLPDIDSKAIRSYVYNDKERPDLVFKKVDDTLYCPFVKYITITRSHDSLSLDSAQRNDLFSPENINNLGLSDTMIVQSFDLIMIKKDRNSF